MTSLLYVDGSDLHSSPHICVANVSSTEPSPYSECSFEGEFGWMSGLVLYSIHIWNMCITAEYFIDIFHSKPNCKDTKKNRIKADVHKPSSNYYHNFINE